MRVARRVLEGVSVLVLLSAGLYAQESSTGTVTAAVAQQAGAAAETKSINTAISDLNYKIELLHTRYNELTRQIDTLQGADRDLKKGLTDAKSSSSDTQEIDRLQSEVELVRSELAQVREDMTLLKKPAEETEETTKSGEKNDIREILHAPWLPAAAMGVALLALIL